MVLNSLNHAPVLRRFPISIPKQQPLAPSQKQHQKDVFFKGYISTTHDVVKRVEQGESASNALIIFLKNANLEAAVASTLLHALEDAVPFVNLVTKAPGLFGFAQDWITQDYKQKVKRSLEKFFVEPNQANLEAWKKAEQNFPPSLDNWLAPAYFLYEDSVKAFNNAAEYMLGRPSPNLVAHKDLEEAIARKATAIACMFMFNDGKITVNKDRRSGTYVHGLNMLLYNPDRFDLITALKVADLYHDQFDKNSLPFFIRVLPL